MIKFFSMGTPFLKYQKGTFMLPQGIKILKIVVFVPITLLFFSCNEVKTQTTASGLTLDLEVLADGFEIPWAIEVISEDDYLFTERMGALYRYRNGKVNKVDGLPESKTFTTDRPYGGMMDISLHPEFESNQMAYLTYVNEDYHLSIARFRLKENSAQDIEIIFKSDQFAIGSRIAWQDKTHFFLSFGTGGHRCPILDHKT